MHLLLGSIDFSKIVTEISHEKQLLPFLTALSQLECKDDHLCSTLELIVVTQYDKSHCFVLILGVIIDREFM